VGGQGEAAPLTIAGDTGRRPSTLPEVRGPVHVAVGGRGLIQIFHLALLTLVLAQFVLRDNVVLVVIPPSKCIRIRFGPGDHTPLWGKICLVGAKRYHEEIGVRCLPVHFHLSAEVTILTLGAMLLDLFKSDALLLHFDNLLLGFDNGFTLVEKPLVLIKLKVEVGHTEVLLLLLFYAFIALVAFGAQTLTLKLLLIDLHVLIGLL
jgi:hypothetical protein